MTESKNDIEEFYDVVCSNARSEVAQLYDLLRSKNQKIDELLHENDQLRKSVKGRIREMGQITVGKGEPQDTREYQYQRAIVITFDSSEDFGSAIADGIVRFEY